MQCWLQKRRRGRPQTCLGFRSSSHRLGLSPTRALRHMPARYLEQPWCRDVLLLADRGFAATAYDAAGRNTEIAAEYACSTVTLRVRPSTEEIPKTTSLGSSRFFFLPCALGRRRPTFRPVRLVIGYPPGGSAGVTARVLADEMTRDLGTAVIVDNRPGAGTTIASEIVARARPDGRTLLINWHQAVPKALLKKLPYDPERDFIPISCVASRHRLVFHPSLAGALLRIHRICQSSPEPALAALGGSGFFACVPLQFANAAGPVHDGWLHWRRPHVALLSWTQVMCPPAVAPP